MRPLYGFIQKIDGLFVYFIIHVHTQLVVSCCIFLQGIKLNKTFYIRVRNDIGRESPIRQFSDTHIQFKKVQVGKDQEKAQSEKDSHSKNRGGKKPN